MSDVAALAGLRVLVVEDEMMVSMLIEDMLSDLGCTVVGPAARLDEAIELAQSADLDCAVLDVNLGGQVTDAVNKIGNTTITAGPLAAAGAQVAAAMGMDVVGAEYLNVF